MILVSSAAAVLTSSASHFLMAAWTSCACSVVATLPVPMAHTGSYAMTILDQSLVFSLTAANWCVTTLIVSFASRWSSVSPQQKMTFRPPLRAAAVLLAIKESLSPRTTRRSEWPVKDHPILASASCSALISPVKAPLGLSKTFCAQTSISGFRCSRTRRRKSPGGAITTSVPGSRGAWLRL